MRLKLFLASSWIGTLANFAADAKSILGALAALGSVVASCYAVAIARSHLRKAEAEEKRAKSFRTRFPAVAIIIGILTIAAFSGCTTANSAQTQGILGTLTSMPSRLFDAGAHLVTSTATNITETAVATTTNIVRANPLTGAPPITNTITVTNIVYETNIVAIAKPALTKTISTGEAVSGIIPPPYGEAAAGGLALISALLAAAVRRRNAELQQKDTVVKTLIQGVENAGDGNKAKEEIQDLALQNGVAQVIHALVKQHT